MSRPEPTPADYFDPVIEVYKKDVDRSLLRENLKLTAQQRLEKLASFVEFLSGLREQNKQKEKS